MNFTPIDLQAWPRGQMFYYFSRMAPTGYSMTVRMDVTKWRQTLKAAGLKFFPAYLWAVTKNLNQQLEFKVAEKDGVLGYYDTLTPLSITCHHATTDGYHVKAFLESLQQDADRFDQYL